MKRVVFLCMFAAWLGAAGVASAEISVTLARAAVGETVSLELEDGSRLDGRLVTVQEDLLIVRADSGRLSEVSRLDVIALYIADDAVQGEHAADDSEPVDELTQDAPDGNFESTTADERSTVAPQRSADQSGADRGEAPPADAAPPREMHRGHESAALGYVTEREFQEAYRGYKAGRRLALFGTATIGLSVIALSAAAVLRRNYNDADCDGYYGYGDVCDHRTRNISNGLFVVAPALLGGGLTMAIFGYRQRAEYAPTVKRYLLEERERRLYERERERSRAFSFAPIISGHGGGGRVRLSF